jgi:hypothetical protein
VIASISSAASSHVKTGLIPFRTAERDVYAPLSSKTGNGIMLWLGREAEVILK